MTRGLDRVRSERGVSLFELMRELGGAAELVGSGVARVHGVHHDSRAVQPGELFVARKGATADGARFIDDARKSGATAVLAARGTPTAEVGLPMLLVDDVASALALAAAAIYEHPAFGLEIVGVTGTNGKTTTSHLISAAVDGALGAPRCGLVGTVGYRYGRFVEDAELTTPEADELARAMFLMRRLGASHVAMEVSSIALELQRVRAVRFTVAALTNLTQDHLDFHGTMAAYAASKSRLFVDHAPGTAVLCVDGELGRELAARVKTRHLTVSAVVGEKADVVPTRLALTARGIDATLSTPSGAIELRSPLVGAHNVENLVVAMGVVSALGLDLHAASRALSRELGAPGRLERCDGEGDDIAVFVDYAHTPDALHRVLKALRSVCEGRVICVFGCGGDRDATKRGPMGDAVARAADFAIVTSDNPRSEAPADIARPIERAAQDAGLRALSPAEAGAPRGYVVELDRSRAIALAIEAAAPGDVVCIAGKGHEPYQIIGTEKRPFDDRVHARLALAARRSGARR
jgi:UDP-N-acetylmuramoyl-L-alanyl-D-glutamate--2,6-diaminopimelate ligase